MPSQLQMEEEGNGGDEKLFKNEQSFLQTLIDLLW